MSIGSRFLAAGLIVGLTVNLVSAERINIAPATQENQDYDFRVISSDEEKVQLEFTLAGFELDDIRLGGKDFKRIVIERSGDLGEIGLPNLPALSRMIAISQRGGAGLTIEEIEYWETEGITIAPLQPSQWEGATEEPDFTFDTEFYQRDEYYPRENVRLGSPVIMRDLRLLPVDFFPFSYNPAAKTLRVVKRIRLTVDIQSEGDNPQERVFSRRSESFAPLYQSMVLNYNFLDSGNPTSKGDYLIISDTSLYSILEPLIEWKMKKGHNVEWKNLSSIGNSFTNIYNYIYEAYYDWEEPPEFVMLVGDVDGSYGLAADYYNGGSQMDVTDHKYSMLEGLDYFPDVQVGRISIANTNQLRVIVNKIVMYERQPYIIHPGWFQKALMIACTSHISCKHTKQWIKLTLLENGYTGVDTMWYSGSLSTTLMSNIINQGVSFVNYRGWDNWGGWSNGNTYALTNYWKLPMVTGMVCNTCDFAESECRAEAFLRVGSYNEPTGAIAACGPSSLYTHTKWNNCIDMGFYAGVFDYGITTATGALNAGKMELWLDFPNNRGPGGVTNSVECYFHEYNMLGDPGLEMWTGIPVEMEAEFAMEMPLGANSFPVTVTYSQTGEPVEDAYACLYMEGTILDRGYTDENGYIDMMPFPVDTGYVFLTITKHDHYPIYDSLNVVQPEVYFSYVDYVVDDDSIGSSAGNGDGVFNPGEVVELDIRLTNSGGSSASEVNAYLTIDDYYADITEEFAQYGEFLPEDTLSASDPFVLSISPFCPNGYALDFSLLIFDNAGDTCNVQFEVPVEAVILALDSVLVSPLPSAFQPGDTLEIIAYLGNSGSMGSGEISMKLGVNHPWLSALEDEAVIASIPPGGSASNEEQPFKISTCEEMVPGLRYDIYFAIDDINGHSQTVSATINVGEGGLEHPVGRDNYGYFAFGREDTGYEQCPQFDWINIGQTGTMFNFNEGSEHGDMETIPLPFDFRYYGQDFDQLTVSSNGWTSLIPSNVISFYNFAIPSFLGADAMVAPFWDDLSIGNARIGYHYMEEEGIFIVAWGNTFIYSQSTNTNTFEVIFYDPAVYPTPTGDGMIKFQYIDFHNTDSGENYATIGIESPDCMDGIEYTFANNYPPNAGVLGNNKAILFTTLYQSDNSPPEIFTVSPQELDTVEVGETVTFNVDAFDADGDELIFNWYHGDELISQQKICIVNFEQGGNDTIKVVVNDSQYSAVWEWDIYVVSYNLEGKPGELPGEYKLGPITPNPFNPVLNIEFTVAQVGKVNISIYNILGEKVASLLDEPLIPGNYSIHWDGGDYASGLYLIRMQAHDFEQVKKAVLLK